MHLVKRFGKDYWVHLVRGFD